MTTDLRELLQEARTGLSEVWLAYSKVEGDRGSIVLTHGSLIQRIDAALAEKAPEPVWCSITEGGVAQIEDEETGELIASGLTPENASRILRAINEAPSQASPSDARDAARLDWLEALFKNNSGLWPMVSIQTIPTYASIQAVNAHNGDEAGLVTAETLRQAIDAAIEREGGA